jgi:hypothetical protein
VSRCAVGFQAEIDAGAREGLTGDEAAEIKALKAGPRRLREDVAMLKAAMSFFVGGSTPAADGPGIHRSEEGRGARGRVDLQGPARARRADRRGLSSCLCKWCAWGYRGSSHFRV